MSVHNILVPNKNNIFCENLEAKRFGVIDIFASVIDAVDVNVSESVRSPTVTTNKLFNTTAEEILDLIDDTDPDNPVNVITPYFDIIPGGDQSVSLGSTSVRYTNLFVYFIGGAGTTSPIGFRSPIGGVTGSGNSPTQSPLLIYYQGFEIVPNTSIPGQIQSTFTQYAEAESITSPTNTLAYASGPFNITQIVNWKATRIGSVVTLKLGFNRTAANNTSSHLTINGFPTSFIENFVPTSVVYFSIGVVNSTSNGLMALGSIDSSGTITIGNCDATQSAITWTNANLVGLASANGDYYTITYSIL